MGELCSTGAALDSDLTKLIDPSINENRENLPLGTELKLRQSRRTPRHSNGGRTVFSTNGTGITGNAYEKNELGSRAHTIH